MDDPIKISPQMLAKAGASTVRLVRCCFFMPLPLSA
jgi:hypothetical protein